MSDQLFGGKAAASPNADDNSDEGIDYIQALSKNGKAPDAAELAKGKYHADIHIARLEREQAEMRKDLEARLSYEALMDQIKELQKSPASNSNPNQHLNDRGENVNEKPNAMSQEEIARLIKETLNQESSQRTQSQNIATVIDQLKASWGNNYENVLLQKAQELGVSKEYMQNLAATAPKAFLASVGIGATAPKGNAGFDGPPRSNVNTQNFGSKNVKNYAYFQKLRKDDPSAYHHVSTQKEMHKLAAEMGDSFYR
jgi:hypothetical protein